MFWFRKLAKAKETLQWTIIKVKLWYKSKTIKELKAHKKILLSCWKDINHYMTLVVLQHQIEMIESEIRLRRCV